MLDYDLVDCTGLDIGKKLARCRVSAQILLVSANQDAFKAGDWPQNICHFTSKSLGPFGVIDSIRQLLELQQLRLA